MRILVVSQYYYPENVSAVSSICESLVHRGHHVEVLTGLPNYGFGEILPGYEGIKEETINGVLVHRVEVAPRTGPRHSIIINYLSFWYHSTRSVKKLPFDFDLVYSVSLSPVISIEAADIYAKKHQVPHVLHCLDLWPESAVVAGGIKTNSFLYHRLFRWSKRLYEGASLILVSSPSFIEYFHSVLKITSRPVRYLPQPPLIIIPSKEPIKYSNNYNIVYAGNVGNLQLIENFVEAAKYIQGKYDFKLHIIGLGSRMGQVHALIRDNGLEKVVDCLGAAANEEASRYYPNATALIVSLADDGSHVSRTIPGKLNSSLFYGRPIIASIGGDGRKVLEEANGSLFSDAKPRAIADMYERLFALSDEERKIMGDNNRRYYYAHFDFEKTMDNLEAQFKELKKT